MHIRRIQALVIALIAAMATAAARGQEVEVVSDEIWLGSQLFTIDDLEALDRAVKLTPEQRDAAKELMQGAMAEARMLSLKAHTANADDTYQSKMRLQEVMKRMPALEQEVMLNLRELLSREQVGAGWSQFQRSRTYLLLRSVNDRRHMLRADLVPSSGLPLQFRYSAGSVMDVTAMVERAKPSEADREATSAAMARYSSSVDSFILKWRDAFRECTDLGNPFDRQPCDVSADSYHDAQQLYFELRQAGMRAAMEVAQLLSEPARSRFQRERVRGFQPYTLVSLKERSTINRALAIDSLSESQRESIVRMAREAERDVINLCGLAMDKAHKEFLAFTRADDPDIRREHEYTNEMFRNARKRVLQLDKQVREGLTLEQQRALDSGLERQEDLDAVFANRRTRLEAGVDESELLNQQPYQELLRHEDE